MESVLPATSLPLVSRTVALPELSQTHVLNFHPSDICKRRWVCGHICQDNIFFFQLKYFILLSSKQTPPSDTGRRENDPRP